LQRDAIVTDSVRKQIVDAAIAIVNTSPPVGFPTVWDSRQEAFDPSELPSILVLEMREDGQSEKEGRWGYFVKRAFTLRFEIRVATGTPRVALDTLYVYLVQRLGQQQFGGLAEDCYDTLLEWQYADSDAPYTLLQIDFRVEYSTLKNDPTKIN
jgi:hypothetical protein